MAKDHQMASWARSARVDLPGASLVAMGANAKRRARQRPTAADSVLLVDRRAVVSMGPLGG